MGWCQRSAIAAPDALSQLTVSAGYGQLGAIGFDHIFDDYFARERRDLQALEIVG